MMPHKAKIFFFTSTIVKRFFLSFLLFYTIPAFSQQINADSILQKLSEIQQTSIQLNQLDTICEALVESGQKGAEPIYERRKELFNQVGGDLDGKVQKAIQYSEYLEKLRDFEKAHFVLQPYLSNIDEVKNIATKVDLLNMVGGIYSNESNYDQAINYYERIVDIYKKEEGKLKPRADMYRNLGKNYINIGDFGRGSIALNKSKSISILSKDSSELKGVLLELGILFSQLGLFDQAEVYIKERQQYIYPPSDLSNALDLLNLGRNLILQQRYDEALNNYHQSLQMNPRDNEAFKMADLYVYNGIVECQYFLGNMDSVAYYFQKVDAEFIALDKNPIYEFLYLQSRFLFRLSKKQYAEAEKDGLVLYERALKKKDGAEIFMYYQFFAELYQQSGDYKKALRFSNLYSERRDSIQTANKTHALLLYQTQLDTKEKEATIQNLKTENEIQAIEARTARNRYLGGGLISLLLFGLVFMRQFYKNKVEQAKQIEELRSKISADLHDDVGSILTGLAMQTEIMEHVAVDADKTKLARISGMSRSAMSRMRDAVWAMDAKKDNWGSLIDRMNEFASEMLLAKEVDFVIDKGSINESRKISGDFRHNIYLIFKEAITNIIKHSNASKVEIALQNVTSDLEMMIKDNGMSVEKKYKTSGQGTQNMQNRAKQINGTLKSFYKEGYVIVLNCPIA